MDADDVKKDDVIAEGHDATEEELQPLEAGTPAEEGATPTAVPGDEDGIAEENTFNGDTV